MRDLSLTAQRRGRRNRPRTSLRPPGQHPIGLHGGVRGHGSGHERVRPLQFRAGSKGPALIHFLTKRCMFGRSFGRPDRPPARGHCAHYRRSRGTPAGPPRASLPRPAAARDVGVARRASRCGCIGGHARKDTTMFRAPQACLEAGEDHPQYDLTVDFDVGRPRGARHARREPRGLRRRLPREGPRGGRLRARRLRRRLDPGSQRAALI